jgi:hypothetical protein
MKTFRELQEEIRELAKLIGFNERGTPDAPRNTTYSMDQYGFGATEIKVTSAVSPASRRARPLSAIIKASMSRDQILAKLAYLKVRADNQTKENERLREEARARAEACAVAYARREAEWKGLIAAAFNDGPPKVIMSLTLEHAHNSCDYRVSLPSDYAKRADFLRKLDDLLASYQ